MFNILILIICFLIFVYLCKNKEVFQDKDKIARKNDFLFKKYRLIAKEFNEELLQPNEFLYMDVKKQLTAEIEKNNTLINEFEPNLKLHFYLPNNFINDNNLVIRYTLKELYKENNNPKDNFTTNVVYAKDDLNLQKYKPEKLLSNQQYKVYNKKNDNIKTFSSDLYDYKNYSLVYEVPTRLSYKYYEKEENRITIDLFVSYHKFDLEVEFLYKKPEYIPKINEIKENIKKCKISYKFPNKSSDIEDEDIILKTKNKNENGEITIFKTKNINEKGEITIDILKKEALVYKFLDKILKILELNPELNVNGTDLGNNIYIVKKTLSTSTFEDEPFHPLKYFDFLCAVLYCLKLFISREEPSVSLKKFCAEYFKYFEFDEEDYKTFIINKVIDTVNPSEQDIDDESKDKTNIKKFLKESAILKFKTLFELYEKIDITELNAIKDKISKDDKYKNEKNLLDTINDFKESLKKDINPEPIQYNRFTINEELDLTYLNEKEDTLEKKLKNNGDTKKLAIYYIKKDLKILLKHRGHGDKVESILGENPKIKDLIIKMSKNMVDKTITEEERTKARETEILIDRLLLGIDTGNLKIINKIIEFSLNEYSNTDILKNKIETELKRIRAEYNEFKRRENFTNKKKIPTNNNMKFIENFESNPTDVEKQIHQHTGFGQVDFLQPDAGFNCNFSDENNDGVNCNFSDENWLKKPENYNLIAGYNFLDEGIKKGIINNLDNLEKELYQLKDYTDNHYGTIKNKLNMIEEQAAEELKKEELENSMTDDEKAQRDFNEKEKEQEEKLKSINQKISDIEKEQNNINLGNLDRIHSVKSFGDGQTLSVLNLGDNKYQVRANNGCLVHQEIDNKNVLGVADCNKKKKNQVFNFHQIKNDKEYNNYLKNKITPTEGVVYPFNIIKPNNSKKDCLYIKGNDMGIQGCMNDEYHKYELSKKEKVCGK